MAGPYPQTGSNIYGPGGRNRTGVGLSTQVLIKVGNTPVGAIQTLSVREQRTITMVDEVGTDGHIDSAPTKSTDISGTCRRVRFDRLRASEAFGRDFLHVHSQRIPFDIEIYDFWGGDVNSPIVTKIKNVWISNISYDYQVDNWLIFDSMEWVAEAIQSSIKGNQPAATGGERGGAIMQLNSVEQAADVGRTRGTMDAPDLIHDFFTNV
jgi:hypothetical protein